MKPSGAAHPWRALAILLLAMGQAHGEAQGARTLGPFAALEWSRNVTTSRNGWTATVAVRITEHAARVPGHRDTLRGAEHVMIVAADCRAAGNPDPNGAKPFAAGGEIILDDHPDAPGAWTWFPVFAFMELTGRTEHRYPMEVRIGDRAPIDTALVRPRIHHITTRPDLHAYVPGVPVLKVFASGERVAFSAAGPDVVLHGWIEAPETARIAARLMLRECPAQ